MFSISIRISWREGADSRSARFTAGLSGARRKSAVARVNGRYMRAMREVARLRDCALRTSACGRVECDGVDGGGRDGRCERNRIALAWNGGGDKARSRQARCVYSPKNFLRLDLDDLRCAVRSLEGQNA